MNGHEQPDIEYDAYGSDELAEIYDAVYADRDDAGFWTALAPAEGGTLELACGTGRVLLPLARAGHEVVGLDLSPAMLARCRTRLAAEPAAVRERVRLVQADMTAFDVGRRFALVTSPFRGFQHLTAVTDQLACLGRCHAHLVARRSPRAGPLQSRPGPPVSSAVGATARRRPRRWPGPPAAPSAGGAT